LFDLPLARQADPSWRWRKGAGPKLRGGCNFLSYRFFG
jgi:hypothetical protein